MVNYSLGRGSHFEFILLSLFLIEGVAVIVTQKLFKPLVLHVRWSSCSWSRGSFKGKGKSGRKELGLDHNARRVFSSVVLFTQRKGWSVLSWVREVVQRD